jgi:hypothetical protein
MVITSSSSWVRFHYVEAGGLSKSSPRVFAVSDYSGSYEGLGCADKCLLTEDLLIVKSHHEGFQEFA